MLNMSSIEHRPQHNLSFAIVSFGQETVSKVNGIELVLALHLRVQDFAGQLHHARSRRGLVATNVGSIAITRFRRRNAISTYLFNSDTQRAFQLEELGPLLFHKKC